MECHQKQTYLLSQATLTKHYYCVPPEHTPAVTPLPTGLHSRKEPERFRDHSRILDSQFVFSVFRNWRLAA